MTKPTTLENLEHNQNVSIENIDPLLFEAQRKDLTRVINYLQETTDRPLRVLQYIDSLKGLRHLCDAISDKLIF